MVERYGIEMDTKKLRRLYHEEKLQFRKKATIISGLSGLGGRTRIWQLCGGDAKELLEPVEHALELVAILLGAVVAIRRLLEVQIWRDDNHIKKNPLRLGRGRAQNKLSCLLSGFEIP